MARVYPSKAPFKCLTIGLVLPPNIRLGWKILPRANTLAYRPVGKLQRIKSDVGMAGVYLSKVHFRCHTLGLALPTNIILGRKSLPRTNTLAY